MHMDVEFRRTVPRPSNRILHRCEFFNSPPWCEDIIFVTSTFHMSMEPSFETQFKGGGAALLVPTAGVMASQWRPTVAFEQPVRRSYCRHACRRGASSLLVRISGARVPDSPR